MPVCEKTYELVALEDRAGNRELHDGELRKKPGGTQEHNDAQSALSFGLQGQLPLAAFHLRSNAGRARFGRRYAYVPAVMVIPMSLMKPRSNEPGGLEVYDQPLPFVAEVWSPSTGEYDVDAKLPQYMARGDLEIWRVHPYERTATVWRRQQDGTYTRSLYGSDETVTVASLPGVSINLASLWD